MTHSAAAERAGCPYEEGRSSASNQIDVAFVTRGHSQYDDDVWRLLRDVPLGFVGSRLPYDHIDYFPLFLRCGASITKALLDTSSYTFLISVRDKRVFIASLTDGLPEYIEHMLLSQP